MSEIFKVESDMEPLCKIKCKLTSAVTSEVEKGLEHVDVTELGEVIDMIKDLAEAEKDCYKAVYYKTVTEAMEEESDGRYGYTKRIYRPYVDHEPYLDEYLNHDPSMENFKMGYNPPRGKPISMDRMSDTRYGKAYNEYKAARRGYTTTNDAMFKDEMNTHAMEHVSDTLATIREIWKNADPDLRKRIKTDFTNLISEMTV